METCPDMTRIPDLPSSGIPRIEVPRLGGGTVTLSCFTGHKLVILYCPADLDAASDALRTAAGNGTAAAAIRVERS